MGLSTGSLTSALATEIDGVSLYTTTSQKMNGMLVTVTLADGTSDYYTWASVGSSSSGVSDTGWTFTNSAYSATVDDTYWNYWTLSTDVAIRSLSIEGVISADVMFDILRTSEGTKDSAYGKANIATNWNLTTSDAIFLTGNPPVGDLWGTITLTYTGGSSGFTGNAIFQIDTDKTLASEVPEPASMMLFGAGVLGLGFCRRKMFFRK